LATRAQSHTVACSNDYTSKAILKNDGENVLWIDASRFNVTNTTDLTKQVKRWYDGITTSNSYANGGNYTGNTSSGNSPCSGNCDFYTQVVWQAANQIGCGVASCPMSGLPGYQLTCQYRSTISGSYGGNMIGATLFTKGTACSACPSGFAVCSKSPAGLCSDGSNTTNTTQGANIDGAMRQAVPGCLLFAQLILLLFFSSDAGECQH